MSNLHWFSWGGLLGLGFWGVSLLVVFFVATPPPGIGGLMLGIASLFSQKVLIDGVVVFLVSLLFFFLVGISGRGVGGRGFCGGGASLLGCSCFWASVFGVSSKGGASVFLFNPFFCIFLSAGEGCTRLPLLTK